MPQIRAINSILTGRVIFSPKHAGVCRIIATSFQHTWGDLNWFHFG
jgi:hypothetical protein